MLAAPPPGVRSRRPPPGGGSGTGRGWRWRGTGDLPTEWIGGSVPWPAYVSGRDNLAPLPPRENLAPASASLEARNELHAQAAAVYAARVATAPRGHAGAPSWVAATDVPVRAPRARGSGGSFTFGGLFAALRREGVMPHPRADEDDEEEAAALLRGLARAAGGGLSVSPDPRLGVAEGDWARSIPATAAAQAALGGDYSSFQSSARAAAGDALDMAADVTAMGAGRVRRVKQSDVYLGGVFPHDELGGEFHQYPTEVPEPGRTLSEIAAGAAGAGFQRLSATTRLLLGALGHGLLVNLSPFNGGGGMALNIAANPTGAAPTGSVSPDGVRPGSVAEADLWNARPGWQSGLIVPSGYGWSPWYSTGLPWAAASTGEALYQAYVLNVWPTDRMSPLAAGAGATDYAMACARRKVLGVAAFAWGIGAWLAAIDRAFQAHGLGSVTDLVVDTIEIGNELDGFWENTASPGRDEGVMEVGRYLALLAGPIQAQVPTMRFRFELLSWRKPGGGTTSFPDQTAWLYEVIGRGMRAEVARWWDLQREQAVRRRAELLAAFRELGSPPDIPVSPGPDDPLQLWEDDFLAAGFSWPPALYTPAATVADIDAALAAGPAIRAQDLIHEVGFHWYHDVNRTRQGLDAPLSYASSAELLASFATLAQVVSAPLGRAGFTLGLTLGEIAFPAHDPGQPPAGGWVEGYYAGTSPRFQAAMIVRYVLLCVAAGCRSTCVFTFNAGSIEALTPYPFTFSSWAYGFATDGLHNDVYDPFPGDSTNLGVFEPRVAYLQGVDCWPRPSWFAFQRVAWILARAPLGTGVRVTTWKHFVVVQVDFRGPIHTDPEGRLVGPSGNVARGWDRAFVLWLDQQAAVGSAVQPPYTSAAVAFVDPSGEGFEHLTLVPDTDGASRDSGGAVIADTNGYATSSPNWRWAGRFDAVLGVTTPGAGAAFVFTIGVTNPPDPNLTALPTVIAPVCLLTNAQLGGISP